MSSHKKFKWKRLFFIFVFFIAAVVSVALWEELKNIISIVLQSRWSSAFICIYSLAGVGAHRFYASDPVVGGGFAYMHFGKYADSVFSFATFALAGVTSLTLLNGIFRQVFFSETPYAEFETMDLASVFIVSSYLLYYCLTSTTRLFVGVLFQVEAEPITDVNSG